MKKKVIISIVPHLKGGGVEKAVLELNRGLINFKDCDTHIITTKPYKPLIPVPENVKVHKLNTELRGALGIKISNNKKLKIIERYIKENITKEEPDLVLCHLDTISKIMKNSSFKNIFHIVHSNISNNKLAGKPAYYKLFKKFKYWFLYRNLSVICVSKGIEEDLNNNFYIHNTQVIYNGISVEHLTKASKEFHPKINKNYFIHVGNFSEAKRQDRLVKAYIESKIKDVDLVLLGEHSKETDKVYELLEMHPEDSNRIHMLGYVSNPYPWISQSSGLILSSDYEGLGMVLIESIALGVPAISTNCKSGPSEIFGESYGHCLCELNSSSLKRKIVQLNNNKDRFKATLNSNFKSEIMCLKYYNLTKNRQKNEHKHENH